MELTYKQWLSRTTVMPNGCRIPMGTKIGRPLPTVFGYSRVSVAGKQWQAHVLSWVLAHGPVPAELDLDHLCRNRACCEVAHLEPVTRRVNLLRGNTIPAAHAAKTHCPKGHPYDDENTFMKRGTRQCRECSRERARVDNPRLNGAHNAQKTHCPQGHPYEGENLRIKKTGGRVCITCARAQDRERAQRKRDRLKPEVIIPDVDRP